MGLLHLYHSFVFPPLTFEIIVVLVLIILLGIPAPLAEYFIELNAEQETLEASAKNGVEDSGEQVIDYQKVQNQNEEITLNYTIPRALDQSSALIKSIRTTIDNIDRTNAEIILKNQTICKKVSNGTLLRAFVLASKVFVDSENKYDGFGHDGNVDLEKVEAEPMLGVVSSNNVSHYDCINVDTKDIDVSTGYNIYGSAGKCHQIVDDHQQKPSGRNSLCSISDIQYQQPRKGNILSDVNDPQKLKPLSGYDKELPVFSSCQRQELINIHLADMLKFKESGSEQMFDSKLGTKNESIGTLTNKLQDDLKNDPLLENSLSCQTCSDDTNASSDTLENEINFQDLYNVFVKYLKQNQQCFVGKATADEAIKKSSSKSPSNIVVQSIPVHEDGSEGQQSDTVKDEQFEGDMDKGFINPTFRYSELTLNVEDYEQLETLMRNTTHSESSSTIGGQFCDSTVNVAQPKGLSKIMEESISSDLSLQDKNLSSVSEFKTKENCHGHSDGPVFNGTFTDDSKAERDFCKDSDKPQMNHLDTRNMESKGNNNIQEAGVNILRTNTLLHCMNNSNSSSVAMQAEATVPIFNLGKSRINPQDSPSDFLENEKSTVLTRNKNIDMNKISSRSRLIFGSTISHLLTKHESEHTSYCPVARCAGPSDDTKCDDNIICLQSNGNSGTSNEYYDMALTSLWGNMANLLQSADSINDIETTDLNYSLLYEARKLVQTPSCSKKHQENITQGTNEVDLQQEDEEGMQADGTREQPNQLGSSKFTPARLSHSCKSNTTSIKEFQYVLENKSWKSFQGSKKAVTWNDNSNSCMLDTAGLVAVTESTTSTFVKGIHKIVRKFKGKIKKQEINENKPEVYGFQLQQEPVNFTTDDNDVTDHKKGSTESLHSDALNPNNYLLKMAVNGTNISVDVSSSCIDAITCLHHQPEKPPSSTSSHCNIGYLFLT